MTFKIYNTCADDTVYICSEKVIYWAGATRKEGDNMKTQEQIAAEIEALKRLAESCPTNYVAQLSIANQIAVLEWAIGK